MKRVVLALLVVAALGCRRKHVVPDNASATPATPGASAAAPPGEAATPTTEPSGGVVNAPVFPTRDSSARMPDGGTLNGDPRGPRPAEWQTIVDRHMSLLQDCFDRANLPPGELTVTMHYTVELPGYTGAVTATGAGAPRAVLDCCVKVVEELKFPEYRGPKVERDLGFTWFKRAPAPPDGGAAKK